MKAPKPLKGHIYHAYSDDMLKYVIRDAGEAMRCATSLGDVRGEGKYADQRNDAVTILHYRQKTQGQTK